MTNLRTIAYFTVGLDIYLHHLLQNLVHWLYKTSVLNKMNHGPAQIHGGELHECEYQRSGLSVAVFRNQLSQLVTPWTQGTGGELNF